MSEKRKIAAILAADVVGFSRMASADEDSILSRLRVLRADVIDPIIASQNGRVFKRTGDGALVEFRSVVEAVRCAVSVQNAMAERNSGTPDDQRIVFRIGIHLGDVVEESDGDLMGDGVNIAARLEGVAKPGAICLSEDAYRQVKGRLDFAVTDLGPTHLKNIAEPVRAYALQVGVPAIAKSAKGVGPAKAESRVSRTQVLIATVFLGVIAAGAAYIFGGKHSVTVSAESRSLAAAPRLSIVVLPFANLSNDPEQDYFADAITEDLTTDLSHLEGSFIIARNTAFTYKGKAVDIRQIGRELGVRYALEGSVRRFGGVVTINAQLVSTETGAHIWAERFERERAQLGELQVEVVARLANAIGVEVIKAETLRGSRERPTNPDAADFYMRGQVASGLISPAANKAAIENFEQALKLDPNLVRAKVGLALTISGGINFGWSADPRADAERQNKLIDEALATDRDNSTAHLGKALAIMSAIVTRIKAPSDELWATAISEAEAARSLDRNYAAAHATSGMWREFVGGAAAGISGVEAAIKLSPRDPLRPLWELWLCELHDRLGQWELGSEHCRSSAQSYSEIWNTYAFLAAAYGWLGRDEEAKVALARLVKLRPNFTVRDYLAAAELYSLNPTYIEQSKRIGQGLHKAGLAE